MPVATMVTGMRNSTSADGNTSTPVTASSSVTECPMVKALITASAARQSRPR